MERRDINHECDQLVRFVEDAARLRLELLPVEQDEEYERNGGKIHYAVDTDVLKLFMNPVEMGANKGSRQGYGVVFSTDPPDLSVAVAGAVSQFIFFELSGENPLILLEGHDAEVRGVFDAVVRQSASLSGAAELEMADNRYRETAVQALNAMAENDEFEQEKAIQEVLPAVSEYLFGSTNARTENIRLNKLLKNKRVSRLAAVSGNFWSPDPAKSREVSDKLRAMGNLKLQWRKLYYASLWRDALVKEKSPHIPEHRVRVDYNALAHLQILNECIQPEQKVVLITGDQAIHRAARKFQSSDPAQTFEKMYVRTPRAFVSSPAVLLPREEELEVGIQDKVVEDWLDRLLARFSDDDRPDPKKLQAIQEGDQTAMDDLRLRALEVVKSDPDVLNDIVNSWSRHTERTRERHAGTTKLTVGALRAMLGKAVHEDAYTLLEHLDQALREETDKSWDGLFDTLMEAGYDLVATNDEDWLRKRNPPALNFMRLPKARNLIRFLASFESGARADGDLSQFLESVNREDSSGYSKTLVYAFAFADRERWYVANQLVTRAIRISERLAVLDVSQRRVGTTDHEEISGREAYFFKCVCLRVLANSADDLVASKENLLRAFNALERDKVSKPDLDISGIRFRAEECALELQKWLFDIWEGGASFEEYLGKTDEDALNGLERLVGRLETVISEVVREKDDWVRLATERNLLTNYFMTLALQDYVGVRGDRDLAKSKAYCKALSRNVSRDTASDRTPLPLTFLVDSVHLFARSWCQSLSAAEKVEVLDRTRELAGLLETNRKETTVLPYDPWRFGVLFSAIERNVLAGS